MNLLLKPIIEQLKSSQAAIYDDHQSLWIDLGWDICQGDGRIIRHAEDMIVNYVESLPTIVRQFIWWESIGGQITKQDIMNKIHNPSELVDVEEIESGEFMEDIVDYLKTALFNSAEADYEDYVGNGSTDEFEDELDDGD